MSLIRTVSQQRSLSVRAMIGFAIASLVLLLSSNSYAQKFERSELSTTCKPCDDFYKYANQGWLDKNPIPDDHSEWGHWDEIIERNLSILHEVLDKARADVRNGLAPKGSIQQKIGDYYGTGMDTVALAKAGYTPVKPELLRIAGIQSQDDLLKEVARLHGIGVDVLFSFGADVDAKNSARVVAVAYQGGLGLPEREYYFKKDPKSVEIREAYLRYAAHLQMLTGLDSAKSFTNARMMLALETKLAEASMTLVEQRDPDSTYHDILLADLVAMTSHWSWTNYLREIGAPAVNEVIVGQPNFLRTLDTLLAQRSISDWKTYFTIHLLFRVSRSLDQKFDRENFAFYQLLYGAKTQLPLWKRRLHATDGALGEALGQAYVKVAFPPAAKAGMLKMIANLKNALHDDLEHLDWISEPTRVKALEKLNAFMQKVGYPDHWRDYSNLVIDQGPFVLNSFLASKFEFDRTLAKIGKPVDRTEWGMTPPTVNAYYNSSMNEIVFPAGILQPPFFDLSVDDAYNYGAIGAIIGHEMTHGFDDEGAKSDAQGNLKNWWAPEDLKQFEERSKCVVHQFDGFTIEDTIHLHGDQVVGESIADLGGVTLSYKAYMKSLEGKPHVVIDGFTPEQRFFIGYARAWASNMRPEYERTLVFTDFHPINYFRVLGPLSNFPPFAAAFHCVNGDKMVRAAMDRCVIW
jgi:putative endopeptidase